MSGLYSNIALFIYKRFRNIVPGYTAIYILAGPKLLGTKIFRELRKIRALERSS